jgi:hypothetical protein
VGHSRIPIEVMVSGWAMILSAASPLRLARRR